MEVKDHMKAVNDRLVAAGKCDANLVWKKVRGRPLRVLEKEGEGHKPVEGF